MFCRIVSQQQGGSGDLGYKVFVIAIPHCLNLCAIGVSENER